MDDNYHMILKDFWSDINTLSKSTKAIASKWLPDFLTEEAPFVANKILKNYISLSSNERTEIKSKLLEINFNQFRKEEDTFDYMLKEINTYFTEHGDAKYYTNYGTPYTQRSFYHMEYDFHIGIFDFEEEDNLLVFQLNTDHEFWGVNLNTWKDLKIRFKSFMGENIEDK